MAESNSIAHQLNTLVLDDDDPSINCNNFLNNSAKKQETINRGHRQHLLDAVRQQEIERNYSTFSRDCLLCRKHFTGNRSHLFQHLKEDHHLYIGNPDNIVYVDEYLNILSEKLNLLQCFYCEKLFKDWMALKEHMRKKQHKRLNPMNSAYDKYFIVNYLEPGKNWKDMEKITDYDEFDDDDDYEDPCEIEMMEYESQSEVCCLFCDERTKEVEETLNHMKEEHKFHFKEIIIQNHLNFYAQVRLVNYIRHQIAQNVCPVCENTFSSQNLLSEHASLTGHSSLLPSGEKWNGPMFFYFPVIENDRLIISLEDEFLQQDTEKEPVIIPEDIYLPENSVLLNEQTRKALL